MKYLYKRNRHYYYKRRIPHTNSFYSFNTRLSNCKKAKKLVIIFNKLSKDLFEYIKQQGNTLSFNLSEIVSILDDYKDSALIEHSKLEESRHIHLSKLFKVEKEDPLLGKVVLSGGQPEVINIALSSFENLAVGNYTKTKSALKKHGKEIIQRATPELKNLFSKLRNSKNEEDLLIFLSMLFKTEAQILKTDRKRALIRFGDDSISINDDIAVRPNDNSYMEEQKINHKSVDVIVDEFLYGYCGYTDKDLEDSTTNASKVKKIVEVFIDYVKDTKKVYTAEVINENLLKEVVTIIPLIPKKFGNITGNYSFYKMYKLSKNSKENVELKNISTIIDSLTSFKRFVTFLTKKKYITVDENITVLDHYDVVKRKINKDVDNNIIKDKSDVEAFNDEMLLKIFDKDIRPYSIIFKKLKSLDIKDIDIYIARFYAPLIMFFCGTRLTEIVQLKTDDCDFEVIQGKERLLLYIEANEQKKSKSRVSKRIVPVHDFLAEDLNLINFVKKAKREKREYLFNTTLKDEDRVSKAFNRNKDFLIGTQSKRDKFFNSRYSLYSFRHLYKTHMLLKVNNESIVHKLQGHEDKDKKVINGYFSFSDELIDIVNKFDKHTIIEWEDFISMTKQFRGY